MIKFLSLLLLLCFSGHASSSEENKSEKYVTILNTNAKLKLSMDGSHFGKATFLNQIEPQEQCWQLA